MMKKIWAAVLALMILALSVYCFASETTTDYIEYNGEQGAFKKQTLL